MDRRQQKTRNAIYQAFSKLLANKDYSKIIIQEIIDEANIGRSTFYSHFETKDYLLKEMCEDLIFHVFFDKLSKEKHHDFSTTSDLKEQIIHICYHIKETTLLKELLTCESNEFFWNYLNKELYNYIYTKDIVKSAKVPKDFLCYHIVNSCVGILKWWTKNKMDISPTKVEYYFDAIITPIL